MAIGIYGECKIVRVTKRSVEHRKTPLKDGAIFVNTSRGEIVDTAALRKAIDEKALRVGLDVFENEPEIG